MTSETLNGWRVTKTGNVALLQIGHANMYCRVNSKGQVVPCDGVGNAMPAPPLPKEIELLVRKVMTEV